MSLLTAPSQIKGFTPEDLLRLPDRNGYELVGGQLRERTASKESSRVGATITGFGIVSIVDPAKKLVMIERQDGSVTKLRENDEIIGETVLPGFHCPVAELLR